MAGSRSTEFAGSDEQLDSGRAWVACVLTLIALFLAFGLTYSYGVFFTDIARALHSRHTGTAGLFATTLLVVFCFGRVVGPIADRTGPAPLLMAGGILLAGGLMGLSYVQTLWQAYLFYGLGIGLGAGCIYVPAVAGVGQWFRRYRSVAFGVAVSGIGLGALIVPPLSEYLSDSIGWRDTYGLYAWICLAGFMLLAALYPRPPCVIPKRASEPAWTGKSRSMFIRLYVATIFINIALYVPFVLLPQFAAMGNATPLAAASLVSLIGVASIVGRLALGALGNRYDTMSVYRGCCAVIAMSYFLWLAGGNYAMLALFAVFIGVGYGGYIALTPTLLAELFDPTTLGRRLGTLYTAVGIGAFVGPIAAGWGVDATNGYMWPLIGLVLLGGLGWVLMGCVKR